MYIVAVTVGNEASTKVVKVWTVKLLLMIPRQKITRVRGNPAGINALLVPFFFISFLLSFVILNRT